MTIDEFIELLKNGGYLTNREEEQIAEWLEELKDIKSDGFTNDLLNMGFTKGYNKAIDDCKELTFREVVYCDSLNDRTEFRELAEQLKAGVENEYGSGKVCRLSD